MQQILKITEISRRIRNCSNIWGVASHSKMGSITRPAPSQMSVGVWPYILVATTSNFSIFSSKLVGLNCVFGETNNEPFTSDPRWLSQKYKRFDGDLDPHTHQVSQCSRLIQRDTTLPVLRLPLPLSFTEEDPKALCWPRGRKAARARRCSFGSKR